jgi:hypothetical protein
LLILGNEKRQGQSTLPFRYPASIIFFLVPALRALQVLQVLQALQVLRVFQLLPSLVLAQALQVLQVLPFLPSPLEVEVIESNHST